ncbi:hypothetical protein [Candidatus Laterigemmans baculatus]|uniref:hypothetical protein n=1 Tax=Candidatus Laterigemmans baculatus TaxID=2770505 RepID=UPI0013DCD296|nr:hypothetical protein [Candidatus Laterigemmans baculatus]
MESLPLWDQPHLLWISIAGLLVFFAASLLVSGWSMKVACRICGVDEISFRYALLVAVVSGSAGIATSLAVTFAVSEPSAGLGAFAPAAAMIATIALLVGHNPFRALGIYVLYSILSALLTLAVFVPLGIAAVFMIPTGTMDQLAAAAAESVEQAQVLPNLPAVAERSERMVTPSELENAAAPSQPKMRPVLPEGVEQNPFVK